MNPETIRQQKLSLLKIQRPVMARNSKPLLLIYSTDGKIAPMMVPDETPYKEALGDRLKAYFSYNLENGKIKIGKEVYCSK